MSPEAPRRPEDERSPKEKGDRREKDDPNLGKKQLDKFLSSGNDDDEEDRPGIGRTLKLAAAEMPDQIVQTLRLPAVEMPGGNATQEMPVARPPSKGKGSDARKRPSEPPPPAPPPPPPPPPPVPPPPPSGKTSTRRGDRPSDPPKPTPVITVSPTGPTADIPASQNPLRKKRDEGKRDEGKRDIPDTDFALQNSARSRRPEKRDEKDKRDEPRAEIPDTADIPAAQNPMRKAAEERERRSTWRLPKTDFQSDERETLAGALEEKKEKSTWELPYSEVEALAAPGAATTAPVASPHNTTLGAKPGSEDTTVEKRRDTESEIQRQRSGEPRRVREPSWLRFQQISGTDKGAPHGELKAGAPVGPHKVEGALVRAESFTRYLATDPDGQTVLLEVASASPSIDAAAFVRAAQAIARLDDARLVRLLDAGEDRGLIFTAYEGYRWRTAENQLARMRPKAERSARIVRDAALGLAAAQGANVKHGTLGANDLLVDDSGRTRVVGLGRPSKAPPTEDLPALGAVLYGLVALAPPTPGAPFLRDATLACPPALEAIVARAMTPGKTSGYASLAAFAADLERFLAGATIEAPPVGAGARLARRLAPRARLLAGALAGVVLLALILVVAGRPSGRVVRARDLARKAESLVDTDARAAAASWDEANQLAPLDADVLRAGPRVAQAVAASDAAAVVRARADRATALANKAAEALRRAGAARRAAEDALQERRTLDPQPGGLRSPGGAWAKVELRRRAAELEAASAEGEAWGAYLLAAALAPQGPAAARLQELERAHLLAARSRGEPATVAFALAASNLPPPAKSRVLIRSTPPGAEVVLERYVARGPRLIPRPFDPARPDDAPVVEQPLSEPTPVLRLELPPGSYRARLRYAKYRTAYVPIYIPPDGHQDWDIQVELLEDNAENAGWIVIPRGPAWSPERAGSFDVGAFVIRETEALDDKKPRRGVSLTDARAIALAAGGREPGRLPSPEELEKAWRGVDGRRFPWGDGFDLGFVRRAGAKGADAELPDAGTNEFDVSPYGVRDLAASLSELLARPDGSPGLVGGSFLDVDPRDYDFRVTKLDVAVNAPIDRAGVRAVRRR